MRTTEMYVWRADELNVAAPVRDADMFIQG
jgi:hypothetical protein